MNTILLSRYRFEIYFKPIIISLKCLPILPWLKIGIAT